MENKFKSWNKFFPHQSQALLKNFWEVHSFKLSFIISNLFDKNHFSRL